jgi:hypothetical protein
VVDHAFDPATTAGVWDAEDAAETGFFTAASGASFAAALRTRNVGVTAALREYEGTPETRGLSRKHM